MTPRIEIGLGRPADAIEVANMSRDLIEAGLPWTWKPSRVLSMIQHPDSTVLIARTRLEIAGFAIMEFAPVSAHLNLLAVRPAHRRRGIGRELVQWLEDSCRVAGIASISLELRTDNDGAKRFYQTLGYQPGQILKGYYQGKESALGMAHQLMTPEVAAQRP